ncbi:MAG: hypothetical protein ACRDOA_19700 [Streptosporangiaceae bacterium]
MFAVAAATVTGWLLLFFVLLVLPPAAQPRRDERAVPGTEPPAVVSLLAGRLERDGLGVTLADLAARGWFRLNGTPGTPGPAGPVMCPVMCTVPAETPAEVLRSEVRGRHVDSPGGRAMIWQPSGAAQPILRIEVRPAGTGPQVPGDARPVPGVAGGYLLGQGAVLYADSCTVTVGIHGAGLTGDEASLTRLLPLVAARLGAQVGGAGTAVRSE